MGKNWFRPGLTRDNLFPPPWERIGEVIRRSDRGHTVPLLTTTNLEASFTDEKSEKFCVGLTLGEGTYCEAARKRRWSLEPPRLRHPRQERRGDAGQHRAEPITDMSTFVAPSPLESPGGFC